MDEVDGDESQVLEPTLTRAVVPAFSRGGGVGQHTAHQVECDHPDNDQLERRPAQTGQVGIRRRADPGQNGRDQEQPELGPRLSRTDELVLFTGQAAARLGRSPVNFHRFLQV